MKNHPILTKSTLAMVLIALLAAAALFKGIDGAVLFSSIAAIAGLAGFIVGTQRKK